MRPFFKTIIPTIGLLAASVVLLENTGDRLGSLRKQDTTTELFKIVVLAPLTGPLVQYGEATRNGFLLKQEETSTSNLNFPNLSFEDNKYDGKESITAFRNATRNKRAGLVYNWGETTANALAPIVEAEKLPLLTLSVDPSPAVGRDYVLRTINHSGQFMALALQYLRSRGISRFSIIKTEDAFFDSLITAILPQLTNGEKVVSVYSVNPDEKDFRAVISRLRQESPDAVGVLLTSGQVSAFYRQSKDLGWVVPTFGTDIFESDVEIRDAQGAMEGAVYPGLSVPEEFHRRYRNRFGSSDQVAYAYHAYRMAEILQHANLRSTMNGKELLQAIENAAQGSNDIAYSNDEIGGQQLGLKLVLKEIRNGKIRELH